MYSLQCCVVHAVATSTTNSNYRFCVDGSRPNACCTVIGSATAVVVCVTVAHVIVVSAVARHAASAISLLVSARIL
jgi:hypothetical protein